MNSSNYISHCRFYRGEEDQPNFENGSLFFAWKAERYWINFGKGSASAFDNDIKVFMAIPEFKPLIEAADDVPLSLKAFMWRYDEHCSEGYIKPEQFVDWYQHIYIPIGNYYREKGALPQYIPQTHSYYIAKCKYYQGEEECPLEGYGKFFWQYEKAWVEFHFAPDAPAYLSKVVKEYKHCGLGHFSSGDGVSIALKAVLWNRWMQWLNGSTADTEGWKHFYTHEYLKNGNNL